MAWVGVGVGITALGTGASLWGSHKANKTQKEISDAAAAENRRINAEEKAKLEDWKNKNSGNYMDTAEAQAVMTQLFQNGKENNDIINSNTAMTGASNASIIAQKKASQSTIADVLRKMSGQGTTWRNQLDNQYFQQNNQLNGQRNSFNAMDTQSRLQSEMNKTQQWSNFMQSLGNMGTSVAMAGANGSFGDWGANKNAGGTNIGGSGNNFKLNNDWDNLSLSNNSSGWTL